MLRRHSRNNIDSRIANVNNEVGGVGCTSAQSLPVFSIWLRFARAARCKRDRTELIVGDKWDVRYGFRVVGIVRRKKLDAIDGVAAEDVCVFVVFRDA